MSILNKQTKQETVVYTIVWILLFLSPLISLATNSGHSSDISWVKRSLMDSYGSLLTFFIFFLIHNHVLAPMIVKRKQVKIYLISCVIMVSVFQFAQCTHRPDGRPLTSLNAGGLPPPRPAGKRPPIDRHDLSMFFIVIMMLGANLGVKYYFQNEEEKKRLARLKEQSLKQELDYLRYQINPHFIMNTLNNIHALVDIDPEQAKDSIVDMSRMMRYLLYESDKNCVSVNKALVFLKKYLNLMMLRYTDQVTVNLDIPDSCPEDISMVPLVFIPFVENAFKHGVSIDKPSTIDIDIHHRDGRLLFHCHNTKSGVKHEYGGVGMTNVAKRLELIYGGDYSLDIKDEETTYDVLLNLPAHCTDHFKGNVTGQSLNESNI